MSIYTKHFNNKITHQTQPVIGKTQVQNSAGGFVFEADKWSRLNRFLLLGTEGGTFYIGEQKLTVENVKNVVECITTDGVRVVNTVVDISVNGRAPKNDPAIFVLALVTTFGNEAAKKAAYNAITSVCRTSTHVFTFMEMVTNLRGTSSGLKRGISQFYTSKTAEQVAYQLIKYRQRNGWTHRDVLRLTHPSSTELNEVFKYAVGKAEDLKGLPNLIQVFEEVQKLGTSNIKRSIQLITENRLPWEAIPTELLSKVEVWTSLLQDMPVTALIRNLGKMTSLGMFKSKLDTNTKAVVNTLTNQEVLTKSRIHPITILNALRVYEQGHGDKGKLVWSPSQTIVDTLNDTFYNTFTNVTPTNKNILTAVDCSGSMNASVNGMPGLTARQVAGAMACVFAGTEPNCEIMGFTDRFVSEFRVSPKMRLDDIMRTLNRLSGGTNCSIPMIYATDNKLDVDAFVILSDNETWSGYNHPFQAMNEYRKLKSESKLIGVGIAANKFQLTDPSDSRGLSIAGFDTSVPSIINEFIGS